MSILMVIIIAISLSMDAFSLSLAYGTLNMPKKQINSLSIIVGLYHFFMPLIGMWVGNNIIKIIPINLNLIVFVVLITIGLQMIVETFKNNKNISIMKFTELLIFGFAVSLDSFTVGLGLKTIYNNPLICAFIFSVCSALFTFLGLYLGKKINDLVGTISTLIGGIVLIIIGIIYLF